MRISLMRSAVWEPFANPSWFVDSQEVFQLRLSVVIVGHQAREGRANFLAVRIRGFQNLDL
ncbi:MAG: hypothetical protein RH862_04170 [Leptospiraceae bacterium]